MLIDELIELLKQQQALYGNDQVKIRDHQSGIDYPIDYVTFWTKGKVFQLGIKKDTKQEK